jgi:putative membrane-bound dehydrogenase-like protein
MLFANLLFATGKQLTGQHAPATSPALSPADAQKVFSVPPGFEVRLFAAEPDVVNPVAMTWDERGRLWVLELYEYPLGAPPGQKGRDRIKILEDTDNDGVADKVTVWADGLNLATGLLLGNGGAYVGQAPDLLFLEDTNHDDKADKRTVLLTGFGLNDRHELLNGFTWGPDGQLYMTHGVFNSSKVKIPEATTPGVTMSAAVARFNPRTKKFEIFADGTSNPWGVDFDKYGNAFVSACVIDHLFHMAPGGIYVRQGGVPENPYSYELLPSIVDHKHYMAAYCGICIYQGDMFPDEYRGHVFMGNIHQNAINHDRLIPNGSSFKAVAEKDFLTTSDGWFRPVSEQVGPDGALWIADWYDKYPCYQNAQADPEGVDRERGRIWRVVYTGKNAGKKIGSRPDAKMDLAKLKDAELIKILKHPNVWQRRVAQRLLMEHQRKGGLDTIGTRMDSLLNLMDAGTNSIETRNAAFWVLAEGNHDRESIPKWILYGSLFDPKSDTQLVHSWMGAKFIGEMRDSSDWGIQSLEELASNKDPRIRLAVATACRQLVSSSLTVDTDINTEAPVGKILTTLIKSSAAAKDPLIPFMIWMASEPLVAAHPEPGLQWLAENGADNMPLCGILARKAMRRICDTGEAAKMNVAVKFLKNIWGKNNELTLAALDGLIEGQKAKPLRPTIDTKTLFAEANVTSSGKIKERIQQLGTIWGDAGAINATLAKINDANATASERIKAIQSAKQLKNDSTRDALLKLIRSGTGVSPVSSDSHGQDARATTIPEPLVIEAFHSLSAFTDDEIGNEIVANWKKLSPRERNAAADTLVSRPEWIRRFLDGLEEKKISPQELSASVVRALVTSKNPSFAARAERLFGKFHETPAEKLQLIAEKRKMVLRGEPNIEHGHEIARKTCFVCHKLYGEGAEVGPDLTGVGRSTLDALLANVIDPNQIVGKGYENVMIETKDGRSVSGRMVENSDTQIKLLAAGPTENVVAKSDIESMRTSELSVMPEGLEQMPDEDFRDLVWFILNPPREGALTKEKRRVLSGK